MNCLSNNFNKSEYSGDIVFTGLEYNEVEGLADQIFKQITNLPFATNIETSNNWENYDRSVDDLISVIDENLDTDSLKEAGINLRSLNNLLRQRLLPRPLSELDKKLINVLDHTGVTDLVSEDDRRAIRYKDALLEIYGNSNLGIDLYRQLKFLEALQLKTIIDVDKREIIDTDGKLNNGLMDYLASEFKKILNYLNNGPLNSKMKERGIVFPGSLYRTDPDNGYRYKVQTWYNVMQTMYNIIEDKKRSKTLIPEIENGWSNMINGLGDTTFYDALNAYINLNYFDVILHLTLGDFISINNKMEDPIEVEDDGDGGFIPRFKYRIVKGNTNNIKNFGVETLDSVDTMSKFSKILIQAIPIYSWRSELKEFGHLLPKDFIGTWVRLKDIGTRIPKLSRAINELHDLNSYSNGSLQTIYDVIFDKKSDVVRTQLLRLGFDDNNLNVLYSFYRTVINGDPRKNNSWLAIENDYLTKNGIKSRYNLVDTLYGVITSNTSMNYLQTVYDSGTETYLTNVKEKYSISNSIYDITKLENDHSINSQEGLSGYDPYYTSSSYGVTINRKNYDIIPKKGYDLLDTRAYSDNFNIPLIEDIIKGNLIDRLRTSERRAELLRHREDPLILVLLFVDDMLNTTFSSDIQSLNELYLSSLLNLGFLKGIFLTAARSLHIRNIYDKFRRARVLDDSKYSLSDILKFLSDNPELYPVNISDVGSLELNRYYVKLYNGYQLRTVSNKDPWVLALAKVRTILAGDTNRSVTTNLMGDKTPNYSPTFLGGDLKYLIYKSNLAGEASSKLLFSRNLNALVQTVVNTDVRTKDGVSKQIKNMTEKELLYDSLINKFIVPLSLGSNIFVQPTTISDKIKFVSANVDLNEIYLPGRIKLSDILNSGQLDTYIEKAMIDTIGEMYRESLKSVINDYKKLFDNPDLTYDDLIFELKKYNEKSLMDKVRTYNNSHNDHLSIFKDLHYRVVKGGLAPNELLNEFANNLYTTGNLKRRLLAEKRNYIQSLLNGFIHIPVNRRNPSDLVVKAFKKFSDDIDSWIEESDKELPMLIIAKVRNSKGGTRNVVRGELKSDEEIVSINPLINAYFMLDNLLGNNLRFQATGSEINHKIKELSKLDLTKSLDNNDRKYLMDTFEWDGSSLSVPELDYYLKQDVSSNPTMRKLRDLYNATIYRLENLGLNAQFKRNVIISATMFRITPSLLGIGTIMNIATIDDIGNKPFNFDGLIGKLDVHDGMAFITSEQSILENKSLNDNEVGTIKKPIDHMFDDTHAVSGLLKYATNTMTNQLMRLSEGNDLNGISNGVNLLLIYKKMTNLRWHNLDGTPVFSLKNSKGEIIASGEIDLINGCGFSHGRINFYKTICEERPLYYRFGTRHFRIRNLGRDGNDYYTEEVEVDNSGEPVGNPIKIYHYFDDSGTHYTSINEPLVNKTTQDGFTLHTIDSNYELWTSLGGLYSESVNLEGYLLYSEASHYATTNYLVHVANNIQGTDPNDKSIKSWWQPLKYALIHKLANNSAFKNGVGNINPVSSWYNNIALQYTTVRNNGYGILQDSDHEADEAKMTEFSLVISSLDSGGYLHDYVSGIYRLLGLVAIELSRVELDAVKEFRATKNKNAIYDIIGRTIMANLRSSRGLIGLAQSIINAITEDFNLNIDHVNDVFKIPFSDRNIYGQILSTFVSNINKKSIKRKYPGLGTVMAASFDIAMIYDINGKTYLFEDLINEAYKQGFKSNLPDAAAKNRDVVKLYLWALLSRQREYDNADPFIPTENVLVKFDTPLKTGLYYHVKLNDIEDYYKFKENPLLYIQNKGYIGATNLKFYKDVTCPRNLAPARIFWSVLVDGKTKYMNIFDHWRVKGLFKQLNVFHKSNKSPLELLDILNTISGKVPDLLYDRVANEESLTYRETSEVEKAIRQRWNPQLAFLELDKGKYVTLDGTVYDKINVHNEAAEIIMSNIYKSTFGVEDGDSLVDVMNRGQNYFKRPPKLINSDNFDLAFTKQSGEHLYITFDSILDNDENFDSFKSLWGNIVKEPYEKTGLLEIDKNIINRVYAVTRDNVKLFEIGREIERGDLRYDTVLKKFIDSNGNILDNQSNYRLLGNNVVEYVEFLSKRNITERNGGKRTKYRLYNINRDAIRRVFDLPVYTKDKLERTDLSGNKYTLSPDLVLTEEINNFIGSLLSKIYLADSYSGMQLNKSISSNALNVLKNALFKLSDELKYDYDLSQYILLLRDLVRKAKISDDKYKLSPIMLTNLAKKYLEKLSKSIYSSFLKSLYFTVARIPSLTLLSFMKMKNVGFTGTETGLCFVSCWLTWLQGSDFDIDKAYVMGLSFDDNGKYIGWSNLFNYSSLKLLEASEYLPFPQGTLFLVNTLAEDELNIDKWVELVNKNNSEISRLNNELLNLLNLGELTPELRALLITLSRLIEDERADRILNKAKLLAEIDKHTYRDKDGNNKAAIAYTLEGGELLVDDLKLHEDTILPPNLIEEANKNFISSHILNTILALPNMIKAYSPVAMEDLRDASTLSPKASSEGSLTLLNPATKFIMQVTNMTGKNVIGISANGEKGSFMWLYYLNDMIVRGFRDKLEKYGKFNFHTSRIVGRSTGEPTQVDINTLPDIIIDELGMRMYLLLGNRLTGIMPVDLMISLVLSAATDNAKELILGKINSGNKLAKMYLTMITLGMNIYDIVSFMTSDVVSFIDLITDANIFNGREVNIWDAIEMAKGNFNSLKYDYTTVQDARLLYEDLGLSNREDVIADVNEFENILEAANEFSNLGRLLGLNQGIPTTKVEVLNSISFILSILLDRIDRTLKKETDSNRASELKDIPPIDVRLWMEDSKEGKLYRQNIKDIYNDVKKIVNVFDVFESIPLFDSIRSLYSTVLTIDHNLSIKSLAYDAIYDQAKKEGLILPEDYQGRLLLSIDNSIIKKFVLSLSDMKLAIPKGTVYLKPDNSIGIYNLDKLFTFDSVSDIKNFKYLFETFIIPKLSLGKVYNMDDNGAVSELYIEDVKNNDFIKGLQSGYERDLPLYKVNLNMYTIENSLDSQQKFQKYSAGLLKLSKYLINGKPLSDWFMLYNLIVNKNSYGRNQLTTLFDKFVSNLPDDNIINRFLLYEGELDYHGTIYLNTGELYSGEPKENMLEINYKDALYDAAKVVSSEFGLKDPYIIVNTEDGQKLKEKTKFGYREVPETGKLDSESQDLYLERLHNEIRYSTLGRTLSSTLSRITSSILNNGDKLMSYIRNFQLLNLLTIQKICE